MINCHRLKLAHNRNVFLTSKGNKVKSKVQACSLSTGTHYCFLTTDSHRRVMRASWDLFHCSTYPGIRTQSL